MRQVSSPVRRGAGRKGRKDLARSLPDKNQGDHFEHNFGHGSQHLSVVFALLLMLAFLVDQVQQLCCPLFRAVWAKLGSKRRLWEKMRALFYDYALGSMQQLFEALLYGLKKSAPILASDTSSSPFFSRSR